MCVCVIHFCDTTLYAYIKGKYLILLQMKNTLQRKPTTHDAVKILKRGKKAKEKNAYK